MEVLKHRALGIRIQFQGVRSNDISEIKKRLAIQAARQAKLVTAEDGEAVYPNLQSRGGKARYVEDKLPIVVSVLNRTAQFVPDFNNDGTSNFDSLCRFCGNRSGEKCVKPAGPYIDR